MVASFGWSAGDVATACTILYHVIKAFDQAKGANKQFRESHAFLSGLHLIVKFLSDDSKASTLPDDARQQVQMIRDAYDGLHAYILKFVPVDQREKSRLRAFVPTIRWTMNELNSKVQNMKTSCLNSVSIMETLIVMSLSSRVNSLVDMGDHQVQSLDNALDVLSDVRGQQFSMSQMLNEYQKLLDEVQQTENFQTADLKHIQGRVHDISASQDKLQEKLDSLSHHLEEKAHGDQELQDQLRAILEDRTEASSSDPSMQKMKKDLGDTRELMGGMGDLTGNGLIQQTAAQVQGVERLFGALSSFMGKRGFGSSREKDSSARRNPGVSPSKRVPSTTSQPKPSPLYRRLPPPRMHSDLPKGPPQLPPRQETTPFQRLTSSPSPLTSLSGGTSTGSERSTPLTETISPTPRITLRPEPPPLPPRSSTCSSGESMLKVNTACQTSGRTPPRPPKKPHNLSPCPSPSFPGNDLHVYELQEISASSSLKPTELQVPSDDLASTMSPSLTSSPLSVRRSSASSRSSYGSSPKPDFYTELTKVLESRQASMLTSEDASKSK